MQIDIRRIEQDDVAIMAAAFDAIGWNKPEAQFERYLNEQDQGLRAVLLAVVDGRFAGYLNVIWQPDYLPFREDGIPEIQDFNVLPDFRRRGIGTRLMDAAERLAAVRSPIVGIGVGMGADYGPAQRLYVLRGYVPDGLGIVTHNRFAQLGEMVRVDDDLVLHFRKRIAESQECEGAG